MASRGASRFLLCKMVRCSGGRGRDRRCAPPAGCWSASTTTKCLGCGRGRPGLFGLTALLGQSGLDDLFVPIVMWGCGAGVPGQPGHWTRPAIGAGGGLFSHALARRIESLFVLGASGSVPVFRYGRWWTILSASWLHGGVLHIVLNMMSVRNLGPAVSEFYGGARTVIIYFVAGAAGFLASSFAGALPHVPARRGCTAAASRSARRPASSVCSAPSCTTAGAGQRPHPGDRHPLDLDQPRSSASRIPRIDNWAHLGGLGRGLPRRPSGSTRSSPSAAPHPGGRRLPPREPAGHHRRPWSRACRW